MRLVKVSAPQGMGEQVAEVAFSNGIQKVSFYRTESLSAAMKRELIGLAAAQIVIVPVWFAVSFVFGFSNLESKT